MSIPIVCDCGARFKSRGDAAGKSLICPKCGGSIVVPLENEHAAANPETIVEVENSAHAVEAGPDIKTVDQVVIKTETPLTVESRERTRTQSRNKKKSAAPLIIGLVVGASALMIAAVVGIAIVLSPGEDVAVDSKSGAETANTKRSGKPRSLKASSDSKQQPSPNVRSTTDDNPSKPNPGHGDRELSAEVPARGTPTNDEPVGEIPAIPHAKTDIENPLPTVDIATALSEEKQLHENYSIRAPAGFEELPVKRFGTPERWLVKYAWENSKAPKARFSVAIQRDAEYVDARLPRVSNRIEHGADYEKPIANVDDVFVVRGARMDSARLGEINFTRARSRANQPPAKFDALLLAAYDNDRMIRISAFIDSEQTNGPLLAVLEAAADSFRCTDVSGTVAPPEDLVIDESAFPSKKPETVLASDLVASSTAVASTAPSTTSPMKTDPTIVSLAISMDGSAAACGTAHGFVHVFDPATGKELNKFQAFRRQSVDALAFLAPRGMATSSRAENTRTYNPETGAQVGNGTDGFIPFVGYAVNGYSRVTWNSNHVTVKYTTGGGNTMGGKISDIKSWALSDDGKRIAWGTIKGAITVWIPTGGDKARAFFKNEAHEGGTVNLSLSPDGSQLLSAGPDGGEVIHWNVDSTDEVRRIKTDLPIGAMCFLDDGKRAAIQQGDVLEIWDIANNKKLKDVRIGDNINFGVFSQNRRSAIFVEKEGKSLDQVHFVNVK